MTKARKAVIDQVAVALTGVEADVPVPSRERAYSFASALANMRVGDAPACRALPVDVQDYAADAHAALVNAKATLRNNVQASINQARRRVEGAGYSVECVPVITDGGIAIVAFVRRTA